VSTLAQRYARAVFELALEQNQLGPITEQVRSLSDAYSGSPELRAVLDNPLIEAAKRDAVLAALGARLGLHRVALNAVRLLAQRHRVQLLPDLARALAVLADEKAGLVRAIVTSAAPLAEPFCQRLTGELEQLTGRKVVLERRQDPSLIAGVVTRIGDHTIDGSIQGHLEALERQLLLA
jgi:F-type H+-transporting ATPase subunit delta